MISATIFFNISIYKDLIVNINKKSKVKHPVHLEYNEAGKLTQSSYEYHDDADWPCLEKSVKSLLYILEQVLTIHGIITFGVKDLPLFLVLL